MAVRETHKTIRFTMTFPKKIVGEPVMHTLSVEHHVVHNTMRGRITEKGAWLEVELVGTAKNIEGAVKYLTGLGVAVQKIDA